MKKQYYFDAARRDLADFRYAYSPVPLVHAPFVLREDGLANYAEETPDVFDYVSLISKAAYTNARFSTRCSFGHFGAPLVVLSDDLSENVDGTWMYGLHFEIVAYENGCNIWHIVPAPENTARPIRTQKIAFARFPIEPDERIDITVEVKDHTIYANVNGHVLTCEHSDIPEQYHVGITACEGPNKFYDFTVEQDL